ncbi:hypothetical protein ES708_11554 [subsurface metagenome]
MVRKRNKIITVPYKACEQLRIAACFYDASLNHFGASQTRKTLGEIEYGLNWQAVN